MKRKYLLIIALIYLVSPLDFVPGSLLDDLIVCILAWSARNELPE